MKISKISSAEYLYHGTGEGAFRNIRKHGLNVGSNGYLYLSNTKEYADSYASRKGNAYGGRVIRVKKTDDMHSDENTSHQGDFKSTTWIPPEDIEVNVGGEWIPIKRYNDEEIGII